MAIEHYRVSPANDCSSARDSGASQPARAIPLGGRFAFRLEHLMPYPTAIRHHSRPIGSPPRGLRVSNPPGFPSPSPEAEVGQFQFFSYA